MLNLAQKTFKMITTLFRLSIFFLFFTIIFSCDKDENNSNNPPNPQEIYGCTNEDALNFNLEATIDDGSCIILGCTDESATNYNPEATDDDNSCEYSIAYILNGTWDIILLDYETEIDLSAFSELAGGLPLGNEEISGQAQDAGTWTLNSENYSYTSDLDFATEEFTLATFIPVPSIPFNYSNSGTWELTNNETDLILTDENTGEQSEYEIISISENNAFVVGTIQVSQDIMGFNFDLELDVQMQLLKQ